MPRKLKSKISSLFVQLNRYERQRKDFSADSFTRDLESLFRDLEQVDISGSNGREIDEHLKQRVNTIPRSADLLSQSIANLVALVFWYVRRPAPDCSDSLVAVKKLRGTTDDSMFIEQTIAPFILTGKIKGFGKSENHLREILLKYAALIAGNFKTSDNIDASATRIIKTDAWQKKMLHLAALVEAGRISEAHSVAPREQLAQMADSSKFSAWYLKKHKLYIGKSAFLQFIKQILDSLKSLVLSFFNFHYLIHVFKNRWPVYLVFLFLSLIFIFGAYSVKVFWESVHRSHMHEITSTEQDNGGEK